MVRCGRDRVRGLISRFSILLVTVIKSWWFDNIGGVNN